MTSRGGAATFCSLLLLCMMVGCTNAHPTSRPNVRALPAEARVSFNRNRILVASANGVSDRATMRGTTIDDPVRVASVSKLIVAVGVMRLVETKTLDLDRDVSDWLGIDLRNPAFPDAPITLRHLLSHTSGLRDTVDYTIPYGSGTMTTVLADPRAWDTRHPPGHYFTYTNLNFPAIAAIMERATGERFDRLMQRLVFTPLKLDACFNWTTCSDPKIARHVVLYRSSGEVARDDLKGQRPDCPVFAKDGCDLSVYKLGHNGALFSPQGGMRISMRDLARIGQFFLSDGEDILGRASLDKIFAPQWTFDGANGETESGFYCAYGLASETLATPVKGCADNLFGDGVRRVGHAGEAYGLRSGLWIDRTKGRGVAFFTSAVPDSTYDGKNSRFTRAEERLATGR
jgi:CubicO group peptidase (beta-lactamase class C family)